MTQQLISFKEEHEYLGVKSSASLKENLEADLTIVIVGKSKRINIDSLKEFIKSHEVKH